MTTIPFGEWTPDQPDRRNGATEAKGVLSIGGHYAPLPDFVAYGSNAAADQEVVGAESIYDAEGDAFIFMGDRTKLYWLVSRVATDISKSGGYSVGTNDGWEYAQFGNYVVAVTANTAPQVYQLGISSLFADLGGSPPQATTVAVVGDFMLMGKGRTLYWSAFNDISDWTPDPATQAGTQVFRQEHGDIKAIVGLDYAAIFQERAIRRGVYVGPPLIWDFGQDAVETRRGAIAVGAAASFGRHVFYASDDGFYVFDGQSSTPIGHGKVDDYFVRNLSYGYRHKVKAAVDTIRKQVVFGFPTGTATNITELLIYSVNDNRWTHDEVDLEYLFDLAVDPLTVDNFHTFETSDDLDTTNLDSITIDSSVFEDRRRLLAGAGSTHQIGTFTGASRVATLDTQEFEAAPNRRGLVTELWPIVDASREFVTAGVGRRAALPGEVVTYSSLTPMNAVGFCPQKVDGRFLRGRVRIAASNWTRAEGINPVVRLTGGR